MVFEYLSEKDSHFIISTLILMPLSPNPPKVSPFMNIFKKIHYISSLVRNVTFKKCQVYFETLCTGDNEILHVHPCVGSITFATSTSNLCP